MSLAILTPDELAENFSFLGEWEERYAYVIDLGKNLVPFPEELKTDEHLVRGCTSRVWLVPERGAADTVNFIADSDAHIVRGLIAILMILYNGQPKDIVRGFPIEEYFNRLGLSEHLSPSRRNGFFAMVEKIKSLAN
jgi:cysteine desulfuration protein SufE